MRSNSAWNVETFYGIEPADPDSRENRPEKLPIPGADSVTPVSKSPAPSVVGQSLPAIDKFVGFNPYDTGVLQKKTPGI